MAVFYKSNVSFFFQLLFFEKWKRFMLFLQKEQRHCSFLLFFCSLLLKEQHEPLFLEKSVYFFFTYMKFFLFKRTLL